MTEKELEKLVGLLIKFSDTYEKTLEPKELDMIQDTIELVQTSDPDYDFDEDDDFEEEGDEEELD